MTQTDLYALVKDCRIFARDQMYYCVNQQMLAAGIYGKRTLRAQLRRADAWRGEPGFYLCPNLPPGMRAFVRLSTPDYQPRDYDL